jgi:hypothetical protein
MQMTCQSGANIEVVLCLYHYIIDFSQVHLIFR